jgi:hypothetical protein
MGTPRPSPYISANQLFLQGYASSATRGTLFGAQPLALSLRSRELRMRPKASPRAQDHTTPVCAMFHVARLECRGEGSIEGINRPGG